MIGKRAWLIYREDDAVHQDRTTLEYFVGTAAEADIRTDELMRQAIAEEPNRLPYFDPDDEEVEWSDWDFNVAYEEIYERELQDMKQMLKELGEI